MTNAIEPVDFRGMPALQVRAPDGARAVLSAQGAQVLSWIPPGDSERLFLSERAIFGSDTPIRGGVPVIFPQFGSAGPLPRPGFARVLPWTLTEAHGGEDYANATLRLTESPLTLAIWPHAFAAEVTVAVGSKRLDVELEIENTGTEAFEFTAALHSYLAVAEVELARLEGLQGTRYRDQAAGGEVRRERAEALIVADEVDRIYLAAPDTLRLREAGRSTLIHSEGFPDTVVWNPWETLCAGMLDMPRDGFRRMLCVEAAVVGAPVRLAPGETWWGRQSLLAI
jgi:glucose-6-phosphate 1-epimerase